MPSKGVTEPDALSRQIMADVLEMLSHQILMDSDNLEFDFMKTFESMEYFWQKLDDGRKSGRLYCIFRLAKIYAASCVENPYPNDDVNVEKRTIAIGEWTPPMWTSLEKSLVTLRDTLIRKDAAWYNDESNEIHPERGEGDSVWYQFKLNKILRIIKIQRTLCKFRWKLEKQVRTEQEGRPDVPAKDVAEFANMIETEFEDDEQAKRALENLVVRSKKKNTRSHGVSLVSLEEVRKIFQVKPFALNKFQKSVSDLLRYWARDITEDALPTLVSLGYHGHPRDVGAEQAMDVEEDNKENEEEEVKDAQEEEEVEEVVNDETQLPESEGVAEESAQNQNERSRSSRKRKKQSEGGAVGRSPLKVNRDLENLKSVRTTLHNEFEDPLEESRKIAASAVVEGQKGVETRSASKKHATQKDINARKPSATVLEFEDTDSEDDENDGGVKLSAMPNRPKIKTPSKQQDVQPDEGLLNADGTKKRKKFTEEEKTAIRKGVRMFGFGKWAKIKSHYSVILRNRTSVNIKDCYRTLMKNNEV